MKKGKELFVLLFSLALLCSCQNDIEESKSEDSKFLDTVMNTVNKKDFLSASVDDKTRVVDLEIADTVNRSKVKKEINTQLKKQDIRPYTINVSQRNMDIVKIENRWDMIYSYINEELFQKKDTKVFQYELI